VIVYLVRHGRAGQRAEWQGDDRVRPLDERGLRQAEALVDQLAGRDFERIFSSPYARCVETVRPLAEARGLPVEAEEALAEGAGTEAPLRLLRGAGEAVVASVHGDLVEELLGEKLKKGATAVLELGDSGVDVLERLPRPA
jgi:phosphohistidine phosphatase SixA